MSPRHLADLSSRSPAIRERWEALLRVEPVSGPLANPDLLVHLIPPTLGQVWAALGRPPRRPFPAVKAKAPAPACNCGINPYLAFFTAAEQALVEAVVLLQAELPAAERRIEDVAEVMGTVRQLARQEIETFCAACGHRGAGPRGGP